MKKKNEKTVPYYLQRVTCRQHFRSIEVHILQGIINFITRLKYRPWWRKFIRVSQLTISIQSWVLYFQTPQLSCVTCCGWYSHCLRKSDKNSWIVEKCLKIKGEHKWCLNLRLSKQKSVVQSSFCKRIPTFFSVSSRISHGTCWRPNTIPCLF